MATSAIWRLEMLQRVDVELGACVRSKSRYMLKLAVGFESNGMVDQSKPFQGAQLGSLP